MERPDYDRSIFEVSDRSRVYHVFRKEFGTLLMSHADGSADVDFDGEGELRITKQCLMPAVESEAAA